MKARTFAIPALIIMLSACNAQLREVKSPARHMNKFIRPEWEANLVIIYSTLRAGGLSHDTARDSTWRVIGRIQLGTPLEYFDHRIQVCAAALREN